jgi:hypothetical protein
LGSEVSRVELTVPGLTFFGTYAKVSKLLLTLDLVNSRCIINNEPNTSDCPLLLSVLPPSMLLKWWQVKTLKKVEV